MILCHMPVKISSNINGNYNIISDASPSINDSYNNYNNNNYNKNVIQMSELKLSLLDPSSEESQSQIENSRSIQSKKSNHHA